MSRDDSQRLYKLSLRQRIIVISIIMSVTNWICLSFIQSSRRKFKRKHIAYTLLYYLVYTTTRRNRQCAVRCSLQLLTWQGVSNDTIIQHATNLHWGPSVRSWRWSDYLSCCVLLHLFLLLLFARGTKGIHLPPPVTSMTTKIVQLWNVVVMMMSEKCGHVTNVCDALLLLDTVASWQLLHNHAIEWYGNRCS